MMGCFLGTRRDTEVPVLWGRMFSFLLDIHVGVELWGHMTALFAISGDRPAVTPDD